MINPSQLAAPYCMKYACGKVRGEMFVDCLMVFIDMEHTVYGEMNGCIKL